MTRKTVKPELPPINWLRAAINDRKTTLKYSWGDIAEAVGVTEPSMRNLVSKHPDPWDWPRNTRMGVCRVLGIEIRQYVVGSPEDISGK